MGIGTRRGYLWGGDYDSAVRVGLFEVLRRGEVLIGGARWCVNHEEVEFAPVDVLEELLNER